MYKIIGGDQREYGPATADELRHWIAEGRLSGQSLVQAEGSGEWRPLATYPEFAEALRTQARYSPAGGPAEPPRNTTAWATEILARRSEVPIGACLARAAGLLRDNFSLFFGAAFLVWFIETVCQLNLVAYAAYGVLRGVFYGGLTLVFLNRLRGRPAVVGDAFAGFRVAFTQLLLAGFLTGLLSWLATACCFILPGIYLFIAWIFAVPLVVDSRLEFWSAMELSRRVVTRAWFEVFALFLLAFLPTLAITLFIQVKMALAIAPAMHNIFAANPADWSRLMMEAANQAQHSAGLSPSLFLAERLIYLVNLPFGLGALIYAYENLFGTRTAPDA